MFKQMQFYQRVTLILLAGLFVGAIPQTFAAVTQISSGHSHTCAVKSDGSVACWGNNGDFQSTPADGNYTQVSAAYNHTCGLKTDGNIVCWGANSASLTPTGGSFTQVAAGSLIAGNVNAFSCGLRQDGTMICTGTYYSVSGVLSYISAPFLNAYACAIKSDGSIDCASYAYQNIPSPIPSPSLTFKQISSGGKHACGVRTSGGLVCWGDNSSNQTTSPSGTFTQVSAGAYHSCAVKSDGNVTCWGQNTQGQAVPPSGTFKQVSAGNAHSCGLKTDGTVVCWGDNSTGQTTLPTDLNAGVVVTPTPTTYTQAQLDAAVNTAKQACVTNPTSCGISVSQNTDGSTQTGIDQCKANPTSCGISISSGYTEEQMSAAIIAGKQNCKISPASCGITVNQNTDGSTQAGIDQCKADPNCKGSSTTTTAIHATYDAAKGELHVPFVDLITLGVVQTFDVYLMQRNGSFTFDLDFNRVVIVH